MCNLDSINNEGVLSVALQQQQKKAVRHYTHTHTLTCMAAQTRCTQAGGARHALHRMAAGNLRAT